MVYDRWYKTVDGQRVPSKDYGCTSRWQVRWRDNDGRQHKRNYKRRRDAVRYDTEIQADLQRGSYIDPADGRIPFGLYAKEIVLTSQRFTPRTAAIYRSRLTRHILPTFEHIALTRIRPALVRDWLNRLQADLAPTTQRAVYALFTMIMRAAVADGLIHKTPCDPRGFKVTPTERVRVWPAEYLDALEAALPRQYQIIIPLGSYLGLRVGELLGLGVEDLDFLRQMVHIRKQLTIAHNRCVLAPPKGGKERDIPLPSELARRIAEHLRQFPASQVTLPWAVPTGPLRTTALLLTTPQGRYLHPSHFHSRIWQPAVQRAKIPAGRNGVHNLRHYFAALMLDSGVSLSALAQYLGHHDPGFTLRFYGHLTPTSNARMTRAIDSLLRERRAAQLAGVQTKAPPA